MTRQRKNHRQASRLAPNRVGRGIGRNIMPAFSQPTSRDQRRDWWRRQFARREAANLSVSEFCRQLGVSIATFYYWRKRVRETPPILSRQVPVENSPVRLTRAAGAYPSNFVPVSILEPSAGTQLEIELTNACVLRLKGVIDPSLLEAAIMAAGRLDGSREGAN
jgi:hypothetical protein